MTIDYLKDRKTGVLFYPVTHEDAVIDSNGSALSTKLLNKSDKSTTVTNVSYDSASKKILKTINNTTSDVVTLATVATSGSYNDLSNTPTFKTINNLSILGSGNITISGGGGSDSGGNVDSVNGQVGDVVLTTDNITEGSTNLYFTDSRARLTLNSSQSTDIAIANGDKLIITDSSDSNKIARTSITFDGSTTSLALSKKGTWESFQPQTLYIDIISGSDAPPHTFEEITQALLLGKEVIIRLEVSLDVTEYYVLSDVDITLGEEGFVFIYTNENTVKTLYLNYYDEVDLITTPMANYSHTHGNITNTGTLQTTDISIASGDKLVVTDASSSNKVARTSLTFDGSTTTQALSKAGSWLTFLTSETSLSKGITSGNGNAVTDISVSGHTITLTKGSTFLTSETSLSKGTTSGSGNAVTDISVSGHTITLTKGSTFETTLNKVTSISSSSTNTEYPSALAVYNAIVNAEFGSDSGNELPDVTSSDNGKILLVVNGAWALVTPSTIYSGSGTPSNSLGNNGDIYILTS